MRWKLGLLVVVTALACGDDDGGTDAATDSSVDASADAGADTGGDAAPSDAGVDAPEDAGPPEPNWECLGGIEPATPSEDDISVTLVLTESLTPDPVVDVAVRACARTDDACAAPIATGTTAATGLVTLALPTGEDGFDGYFEFTKDGFQQTISVANPPITESNDPSAPLQRSFFGSADFGLFIGATGATPNPARGHIGVGTGDCGGADTPNAGTEFLAQGQDGESVAFYLAGGLPDATATETDASGQGGFVNVLPGRQGVRVNQGLLGYVGGLNDVLVRAGWFTSLAVPPSPDDGNWSCLGSVIRRDPMDATALFTGQLLDTVTQSPIEGVAYRVCALTDTVCASPIIEGTTNAAGTATGTLPLGTTGFNGFVEMTAEGYPDHIAFFNPPIVADTPAGFPTTLFLTSDGAVSLIEAMTRVDADPTRAQLMAVMLDCGGFNSTDVGEHRRGHR